MNFNKFQELELQNFKYYINTPTNHYEKFSIKYGLFSLKTHNAYKFKNTIKKQFSYRTLLN